MCVQVSIYIGESSHQNTHGRVAFLFDKVASRHYAVIEDRTPTGQHVRPSRHSNCRQCEGLDIV